MERKLEPISPLTPRIIFSRIFWLTMGETIQPFGPEYLMSEDSPRRVVHETGILIPLYLKDLLPLSGPARDYFQDHTLGFLRDANRGFLLSATLAKTGTLQRELGRFLQQPELVTGREDVELPHRRSLEAYGIALTVFGQMPHLADATRYVIELSNTMPLSVPRNSMETQDRLDELKRFIELMASRQLTARNLDLTRDRTHRVLAFFQVGRDMPDRAPLTKEEIVRKIQDAHLN